MLESAIFSFFSFKGLFALQRMSSRAQCGVRKVPTRPSQPSCTRRPLSRYLERGPWPAQGAPPAAFCPNPLPGHCAHPSGSTEKPDSPQCCGLRPRHSPGLPRTRPLSTATSPVPGTAASGLSHECLPRPILAWPRGSPCETGTWQHLPSGAAAGSAHARGAETGLACGGVWSVSSPCGSLPRPRSVRLSARRGLAGAWGPLSAWPPSSSHGRRRPPRRRSRTSPGSQSGRLATAGLLATAVFPEQGGGTQCIMGQGGVTFRLALGPPPQPHSQTF